MIPYEFHPVADLFPLLDEDGEEFKALVEDIKTNGLLEIIISLDDKILDGRNRYRACLAADIRPQVSRLPDGIDPLSFVVSKNFHRRHLTASQQSEVLLKLREQGMSYRTIANLANVPKSTVARSLDKKAGVPSGTGHNRAITGKDGKSYPATRSKSIKPKHSKFIDPEDEARKATVALTAEKILSTGLKELKTLQNSLKMFDLKEILNALQVFPEGHFYRLEIEDLTPKICNLIANIRNELDTFETALLTTGRG